METIRGSEEKNRVGTEQNEKQGMALLCDGNSLLSWVETVIREVLLALGKWTGEKQTWHSVFMGSCILLCTEGQEHQIWSPDCFLNSPKLT